MSLAIHRVLCPHRGLGEENSLNAIKEAVSTNPFMVEFDVQNIDSTFYLGHPPKVNYEATLSEALLLYEGTCVMPKVDIKCNNHWRKDIDLFLKNTIHINTAILVNIGGETLTSSEFIEAEAHLTQNSKTNILLNVDIARYKNISTKNIVRHLNSLTRPPYSVSPMIEGDYASEISLAQDCNIINLHFWSNNSVSYTERDLLRLYDTYSNADLRVQFDINPNIIAKIAG